MKAILIVLDSVGVGYAPDAEAYGDAGAATLPHVAAAKGSLSLPNFKELGLGNIPGLLPGSPSIMGVPAVTAPRASYGVMLEQSEGKDTITGHWELAGLQLQPGFQLFPPGPPSFPDEIIAPFVARTGRGVIGNKAASGIAVIEELGKTHMASGDWIVYTSADSVFQIAAHEQIISIEELYQGCEVAREICDAYRVGRVIARPFRGEPGSFVRSQHRRDFAYQPEETTILERLTCAGKTVLAVGKIEDIFSGRGIAASCHSGNNYDAQCAVEAYAKQPGDAFIFANFIDFDMLYGHRRDPAGYADSLEATDAWLEAFLPTLTTNDVLILTADHGNDPTFKGTDHTREAVPLLVYQPGCPGRCLGVRHGFYDVAQSIASFFRLDPLPRGESFLMVAG